MKSRNLGLWIFIAILQAGVVPLILTIVVFLGAPRTEDETIAPEYLLAIGALILTAWLLVIPAWVWLCSTHKEMTNMGYNLPTRVLYFIPLANVYAIYKYCEAMEQITNKQRLMVVGLILSLMISHYALLIYAQQYYNRLPLPSQPATPPQA